MLRGAALSGRGRPWHRRRAAQQLREAMQGDDLSELGAAIRAARRALRMTLRDLEAVSGWSRSMIAYMERGERWSDDAAVDVLAVLVGRMGDE